MTKDQIAKLSPELRAKLTRAASDAVQVQNACNLSGVANSFTNLLQEVLWPVAHSALGLGTDWIRRNPISRLFAYKMNSLAGHECLCDACWREYREACAAAMELKIATEVAK